MRDLLIIPTFNRPEMLTLCIEGLIKTGELRKLHVLIVIDDHIKDRYDPDVYAVLKHYWGWNFNNFYVQRQPHNTYGNSRSVMEAYKEAYATDARLVFMVEDDIIVSEDFFRWCYTVHADERIACVVATRPGREGHPIKQWEGHYVDPDFASGAVCWKRERLSKVVEHANHSFYNRLDSYCDESFPNSKIFGCFGEQDGLIRRIAEAERLPVAWPWYPRAKHIGVWGYHGVRPDGTYQERLAALRKILADPAEVAKWRGDCDAIIHGH